ncbi:MAG: hypothetical protein C7B44_11405 [Sulfobacillus thermosulfidooxidans]|nr:MAG: hypothetical protein C7B44_11405 [Sulfobacillus thermosulfidooxidans]
MDMESSVNAYHQSRVLSDNPDFLGRELYRAVYRDLLGMDAALREQRWDRLTNLGSHAQLIITALHDVAKTDTPEGMAFKTAHLAMWRMLNDIIRKHDAGTLADLTQTITELIHQLDYRLQKPVSQEPAVLGWSG